MALLVLLLLDPTSLLGAPPPLALLGAPPPPAPSTAPPSFLLPNELNQDLMMTATRVNQSGTVELLLYRESKVVKNRSRILIGSTGENDCQVDRGCLFLALFLSLSSKMKS